MRDANPNLTLHFCALHMPPVREKNWEAFRQFNAEAKALADIDPNIYYIDFAAATSNENGGGREDLFQKDRLHLTRDGEKVLIPLIKESLQKAQNDAAAKRNNTLSGAVKGEPLQNGVAETLQLPTTIDFNKWSLSLSEQDDVVLLQLHQIEDGKKKQSLLKRVYRA